MEVALAHLAVRHVAARAAAHQDLEPHARVGVEQRHARARLAGADRGGDPRGAGPDHEHATRGHSRKPSLGRSPAHFSVPGSAQLVMLRGS